MEGSGLLEGFWIQTLLSLLLAAAEFDTVKFWFAQVQCLIYCDANWNNIRCPWNGGVFGKYFILTFGTASPNIYVACMQFITWEISNVIYYSLRRGEATLENRPPPGGTRYHGNSEECPVGTSFQQKWSLEREPKVQHYLWKDSLKLNINVWTIYFKFKF